MENIFKMLSDYSRVRILNTLSKGDFCVTELSNILSLSISSISRHMSKMKLVGMVTDEKDAQWVYYKLNTKFQTENSLLLDYIQLVSMRDSQLIEDNKRIQRYTSSGLCCRDIYNNKETIENVLKGDANE